MAQAPLWRVVWLALAEDDQILAFTFHHSIIDEWSLRLLVRELEAWYAADGRTNPAGLAPLAVQYADFAAWQKEQLAGRRREVLENYWREQLRHLPPPLELPADRPRPIQPTGGGAVHEFKISGLVVAGMRRLARQEKTTLFTVALAACQVWLHRYTGKTDLLTGTPAAHRERPEVQSLLGYFLNTLPVRTRLKGEESFLEVAGQMRETLLCALSHADLPIENIIELAGKPGGTGQSALFQVMFVLLEEGLSPLHLDGTMGHWVALGTHTSKNNLLLSVQADETVWHCQLEYATDLFTQQRAASMAGHFMELCRSIVAAPQMPINQLNLMTAADRQQILGEWRGAEANHSTNQCVHQLFELQAAATPDAAAVAFEQEMLTYHELNLRANRLAHHLRSRDVGPDTLVGLCVERSLEMCIGVLGILKAGAAYVPLDPALPPQRLAFLISNSECAVIVTQNCHLGLMNSSSAPDLPSPFLVLLETACQPGKTKHTFNPKRTAGPDHLAYVLYTSGSTGRPKGVEMPHRPLVNLIQWQRTISSMGPGDRTLQFASLGFDVSFQEMFSTWATGGTLVVVPKDLRIHPAGLLAALNDWRINRMFLPFVMLEQLAEADRSQATPPAYLKEVAVAGEQLRIGPGVRRFFGRLSGGRLWNHYGPAEAHVVTSYELPGPASTWPDLPPIGRPLPNCEIYLLDAQLQPVTAGMIGELYIGGICLSRGYHRRPDLTAEHFIPHPFAAEPGARLYRTGDLARWQTDGNLEFLGRSDHQVKLRGFRVELGEIEAMLGEYPDIAACVVVAEESAGHGGDKSLAAYLVGRAGITLEASFIRTWLKSKLPDYMIPARLISLPALPMNANGKVERSALKQLGGVELQTHGDWQSPSNEREHILVEIWQAGLRRDQVGVHDNFFDLGGHSLLAAVICSQITERLGLGVPLRWLFENPTITRLAKQMENLPPQATSHKPITTTDRHRQLPMSFAQQGMWLLDQTLSDPTAYNQPIACRLSGRVDKKLVKQCLQVILERHEVLRTGLALVDEDLVQEVISAELARLPWQEQDISGVPVDNQPMELAARLTTETRRPFDLAKAPLWRVVWITLNTEDHVLAFTFQHAIIDEWSMRRLFQELELLYAVQGQTERAGLPELSLQYADYAVWQRQQVLGPARAAQIDYWREQLGDLPPALPLPADHPRPPKPSGRGAIYKFQVTGSVPQGFRELARQENTSLFTVAFAAYFVWLHRLTSRTDILVGTPVANRERPEVQALLGLFLNALPIRATVRSAQTFREVVRQLREVILTAFDHASLPFERIVEIAAHGRAASQQPLFETMFVLLEQSVPPLHLAQAEGTIVVPESLTSKYDLLLSLQAREKTWECEFEYTTDLFSAEQMERLARLFSQLLLSIVDQTDVPIAGLNIMTSEERRQILVEWNRTGRDYPRNARIHDLFEEQCRISPDAVAVVFDTQQLTYQELNHQADRLAGHLRARGVGPGVRVGLRLERSLELVISLLGILKAGGAYWSIEEKLPEERLRLLLADASPRVLLARQSELAALKTLLAQEPPGGFSEALEVAAVEAWLAADEASGVTPALVPSQATDAAYVSYTSGSTGRPKGVIIPHRGVVRLVRGADYVSLTSRETILHHSPLAFDASTFELWGALLNGGRVVLMPPGTPTLAELGETIRQYQVTMLWLTSGLFNLMVEEHVGALAPVRQLLAGGDVLSPVHVRKARRALPACRIINGYGPTENTTFTCCHTVGTECEESASIPIGRPIANTRVYVLDENRQPVPAGVAGELYAGGDGLACGYLNQPELTAERFIPDPFGGRPEDRLYRTGDLVRWRMDGTLEFLGRLDQQVKIRGFHIELGEIETAISAHPAIKACAVLAETNDQKPTSLKAFLVLREGEDVSLDGLRAWLATKLPDYMIPGRLVTVSALPLTTNGKLDRRALESLPGVELPTGAKLVVPRNECERVLTEIWQGLLHREQVSVLDNFFDLGGHSLLVAVMCARIAERLQREVHLRQVLAHPTIAGLASQLALPADATDTNRAVTRVDRGRPLPMSFGQQGMWLLQQTLPDPAIYHVTMACRITGQVDRERIRRALQVIQNRHEILRTALVLRGQDLVQEIAAQETSLVPWRELQLLSEPTGRKAAAGQTWLQAQARLPFDLAQAPLWRADWLVLAEDEHVFALTFHHSIIDDWSRRLLLQELETLYASDAQTLAAGLPDLPVQYADYAVWQREELAGERFEKHRAYWRQELTDLPPALELPADLPRPLLPSGKGAVYEFQIPESTTQSLRELARQERTTLFTVALAAFYVWLHRHTSQTDLVVGTPAAHRDRAELQSLLGYFLNTLPIRARLNGAENFRELVGQVRQKFAAALDHADLPFEQMVELAVKERTAGQSPVYQVMFVLLEAGLPPLHLGQAQGQWLESDTHTSKHDLILSIQSDLEGWKCELEYATDLFTSERVATMAGHLVELLAAIAAHPQTPIGELNLLTATERQQILVGWNRTSQPYPRNSCIHQLFEEQCRITPEAVAVVLDQQTLTYQELNRQATRLAGHLRARGVAPGVRVGLRVERSLEMVISLLGILQAGGTYWSVEENLPEERLRLLLADARPRVLLARQKELPALKRILADSPAGRIGETLDLAAIEPLLATDCAAPAATDGIPCQATDPAYISYTSGSTGRPKGVIIHHRGVVRLVRGVDYVSLTSRETILHHSPLSFDASTFELWGALLNGGRVILMPPGTPALAELADMIRRHKVNTLWLTAGLFNLMVEEQLAALQPIRQLLAGGDVLSPAHVRKARRALPACRIINGYGPTENTTFTCCHTVGPECEDSASIPIGRPIANTRVYVLDANRQPVPPGVSGELYTGGDGLACGYLNQPEFTAERFIADPFGASPDDRLYRTGDLVRWRPDGILEFLGRVDQQVKIRGFRVELGEIETMLGRQPEVSHAVVVVRNGQPGDKQLVAYLVAKTADRPAPASMRDRLAEKLPDYMLPDRIVWLEHLPLTTNGKVNRQALPAPEAETSRATETGSLPLNLLELELTRIWQKLFQREDINRQDNFFDLGGHSLQAIRLAAAIDRLLGCKIPIAALFQCPTIESLARRLSDENWAPRWHSLVPLQTHGDKPPLFLIHGIAGDVYIFTEFAKLLGPDQPVYGIQAVGLDGTRPRHTTIQEMAAHYVQEITSFQPDGPIYLAGYSLGGTISWEIAQQLHRAGRCVALLGLLDSDPSGGAPWIFYALAMAHFVPDRLLFHFRHWWQLPWREKISYHRGRLVALQYWLQINEVKPVEITPPPAGINAPLPPGFFDYYQAVSASYRLQPYPGCLTLFYGDEALTGWNWYWRYLAKGGSRFYRVPGKHQEFLSPANIPTLARAFSEVLRQTQAAAKPVQTSRPHGHATT